jgi:hypothetical protein
MVHDEIQKLAVSLQERRLLLVSAPASDNDNLRAQRWVGLLYRHSGIPIHVPLIHRSYDELADESFGTESLFFKLTLPTEESGELLRLLAIMGVRASTVFPGFGGAAKAVNEMSRWPTPGTWDPAPYEARKVALFKYHHLDDILSKIGS